MNYNKIRDYVFQKLKKELSPSLHYHGLHHTEEVIRNVEIIAKNTNIEKENLKLLKIAALFHDIGFISKYKGHEEFSCKIATDTLPKFDVTDSDIDKICGMIMATKIPQKPNNILEKIIADADLMYLGTDNFVAIGNTLFEELKENKTIKSEKEWNNIQSTFMASHTYHTPYCIENFSKKKLENLNAVNEWLSKN